MKNNIKIINNPKNLQPMQTIKNLQPQNILVPLQNSIIAGITEYTKGFNLPTPTAGLYFNLLNSSLNIADDNSGCLTLVIAFNAPDTNDACDAATQTIEIAKTTAWELSKYLNTQNKDSVSKTQSLEPNAFTIYNHIDGLNYLTITIMATDATLYITAIYNQQ